MELHFGYFVLSCCSDWRILQLDNIIFLSVVELDSDINKCCPACFNRIARMMGTNPQTNEPLVAQVPDDNTDGEFIYNSSPDYLHDEYIS